VPNPLSRATAFVTLQTDDTDTDALVQYAREHLARYKVPKRFGFGGLPKTSTGASRKTSCATGP
jgi:fatty-acyl-CoA synthase